MKNILIILQITCVCLSTISCATKSNDSAKGVFFYRESFGEWGWHEDGDEEKDGIYEGETRKGKPDGQGTYTHYKETKSSVLLLSVMIPGWGESIVFALIIWELLHQGKPKIQDAKYVGAWKRGEKHGDGTYYFPNGDRYVGEWRRGKKHVKEYISFLMETGMRETGGMEENMDKVHILFLMAIYLLENGRMGRSMVTELTLIPMGQSL